MIDEGRKDAENGVVVSLEVAGILGKLAKTAETLTRMNGEVATASDEQAKGIEQVNTAVSQMDKVTQGNAASAEESASASEELSAQAQDLKQMVNELLALVGGRTGPAAPRSAVVDVVPEAAELAGPELQTA
jgi:methyl-accepting chemotaxis protein